MQNDTSVENESWFEHNETEVLQICGIFLWLEKIGNLSKTK